MSKKERRAYFDEDGILRFPETTRSEPKTLAEKAYDNGVDFAKEGRPEKAISEFKKAIEQDPNHVNAHYNLAVTYYAMGKLNESAKEYEVVLKLRPDDVDVLNNFGVILATQGKLEEAKNLFDKALDADQGFALTHRNLAVYWDLKGDWVKREEHRKQAIKLDKDVFDREPGPPRIQ